MKKSDLMFLIFITVFASSANTFIAISAIDLSILTRGFSAAIAVFFGLLSIILSIHLLFLEVKKQEKILS